MIKEGDTVLLLGRRRLVVRVLSGFSGVGKGSADLSKLIGMHYGEKVRFWGEEFRVYKASLRDLLENFERGPQVITRKDAAMIANLCEAGSGDLVLEAGTGSGWLTVELARSVMPEGRVISYDMNDRSIEIAKKNIKLAGLDEYVEIRRGDIREDADIGSGFSAVSLDMPDPWNALPAVEKALVSGGHLCIYVPTYNQVEESVMAMKNGFFDIEAVETILRSLHVIKGATRPEFTGLMHTGFIIHGRKV